MKDTVAMPSFDTLAVKQTTAEVIRTHSKTFYFATNLLPTAQREAVRALYAFCRTTDDLVDRENATESDLIDWRKRVNLPFTRQTNPVLMGWTAVREQYQIDRHYESELIDGVVMDLKVKTYASWQDLQIYCYRVASTVGLLSLPIIGLARGASFQQAAPYAIQLGIALQLTNILRDVGEDRAQGRVYLPEADLARFGLSIDDIRREVYDQRFMDLMKFEIQRARDLYQKALPGIALLAPSVRLAVGAAALIYREILDEIEKIHYQVYQYRAHTGSVRKLSLLPEILLRVLTLRRPQD